MIIIVKDLLRSWYNSYNHSSLSQPLEAKLPICQKAYQALIKSLTGMKTKVTVPGGRLNKKDGLTRYGDSHVKDKTS